MEYRLHEIAALCSEQGLKTNIPDKTRIDITICEDCVLSFLNLLGEDDTLVGFDGTPWHSHGVVKFRTGPNTFIDCDELDIIIGLITGELLIVTQYLKSTLTDRWLIHKDAPFDELQYIEAGEELKIYRFG